MRYFYLILLSALLSTPFASQAQMSGSDSLRQRLNFIFAPLDKSQVPTRLLAEYAHPFVPLAYFDGTLRDSTRTNASLWRALYAMATSACVYGANPLPSLQTLNARAATAEATSPTIIPVLVQRLDAC